MNAYAELHCQSVFSLLDGASTPETLLDRAARLGLHGLALTDFADMGGVVRFTEKAKTLSIKPIVGNQVYVSMGAYQGRLVLLAENPAGYANLCQLITLSRLNCPRGFPSLTVSQLSAHSDGLFCLSGGTRGALYQALSCGDQLGGNRLIGQLKDIYPDRFAVEVVHHGLPAEMDYALQAIEYAKTANVPWVVTNDVRYATVQTRSVYDTLRCLKAGKTIESAASLLCANSEWFLKSPRQMWQRWRALPDGLHESIRIADRCSFSLAMLNMPLPETEIPPEFNHADDYLQHLVELGMEARWYTRVSARHKAQIQRELNLIFRRKLSGYFLIMWEIISYARHREILVQGRGSAANSAVCYVLGITAVDPIAHQLLFERFLSDAREGYPDIDLDIEHARREEIIQFVYQKYGRDKAAMVCAHQCFRSRSAVRDVARVLEFTQAESDRLAKLSHRHGGLSQECLIDDGWSVGEGRFRSLVEVSNLMRGIPRHRGTHSGGFVLSAAPIARSIPIEPAAMAERSIIQWDKEDLEATHIPKFDLLGLGILTAISRGLDLIRDRHGVSAYLYRLPQDPRVYDMMSKADTVGVFQIESRAQMNSLPRTRPSTLYELAIQVALIRPGPLQGDMVHPYIRRKRGEEPVESIHPLLDPILHRTLGIPLFQEQGMRLAVEVAGFSPTDAERLRRAIGSARCREQFPDLLKQLEAGFISKGIPANVIEKLIRHIAAFATYGFPESHSTSFALLVYASAWIKCFYPAEFLTALLHAQPLGFYNPDTLISDAQRHGVSVISPCLKRSQWHSYLDGDDVIVGLRWVRGLGPKARVALEAARNLGPFEHLDAVFRRCVLSKSAWLTLVGANTFRALIPGDRRQATWYVLRQIANQQLSLDLRPKSELPVELSALSPVANMKYDYENMGLTTGAHPMLFYRGSLPKNTSTSAMISQLRHGQWVRVAGVVIARQRPETAKGFCFISLEDEYGFINVIVAPSRYERYWREITRSRILIISGTLSAQQDELNIKALHIDSLTTEAVNHLPTSHDFH
jgi:error-prone DNA polymerase